MTSGLSRRAVFCAAAAPFMCMPLMGAPAERFNGAISVRDFGAVGDGRSDDTAPLVRAHASNRPVYYPRTAAFYSITHVIALTASAYSESAEIRIIGDGNGARAIFRIQHNSAPIVISGFVLDGGYKGGTQGEWSHGIDMQGARKVTIVGNTIRNVYGDCIYVGSQDNSAASENIRIEKNTLFNPRRCNVAVVCGENIAIINNVMEKPSNFVAAVDLEPNVNGFDFVRRIQIANNTFDTSGTFLSASVNNGIDNIGLRVSENHGRAWQFLRAYDNAHIRGATITKNRFITTKPDGAMLVLSNVQDSTVLGNVDDTVCGVGYRSVRFDGCTVSLSENRFCS